MYLQGTLEVPPPDGQEGGPKLRPPPTVCESHAERFLQILVNVDCPYQECLVLCDRVSCECS